MKKARKLISFILSIVIVALIVGVKFDLIDVSKYIPEEASSAINSVADEFNEKFGTTVTNSETEATSSYTINTAFSLDDIPEYTSSPYVIVNDNVPYFTKSDYTDESFENYGDLDELGRCTVTFACIGYDLMPTEERGNIGSVKPTGWHTVKYDCVDGKYLYNRCHLIGYQLTGENANKKNLITGTRYLNVEGMLPFENMVADYIKEEHAEGNDTHVLYRVTPIFEGDNLLASGVLMEAQSVGGGDDPMSFCVYCYNVQPGVTINYSDGSSYLS